MTRKFCISENIVQKNSEDGICKYSNNDDDILNNYTI